MIPDYQTLMRPVLECAEAGEAAPSVKQHLAAIRMLFDWLVVGQVVAVNPASSVRGPKHSTKKGKTPVLAADEAELAGTVYDLALSPGNSIQK
jgi:site-specific recombinase XerC